MKALLEEESEKIAIEDEIEDEVDRAQLASLNFCNCEAFV
jgi:hypothetical protein